MSDYRAGDIVDITIQGARIIRRDSTCRVWFAVAGTQVESWVCPPSGDTSVTVERIVPADWPPQAGDLWRDRHGELWFVHRNPLRQNAPLNGRTTGGARWTDDVLGLIRNNAPLTLVHREPGGAS